ncbi:histidine phosphatase family protein [Fictibacillus nanhaiensis]|uniref:histidine phosphatase family protein n=1 Tax=Fictibacillus nanhaiensis TaxID=742169 RepID=UPI001C939C53|nr:histidine phosphatase family protein [Fictibacillus nanhaiensis]MBY6036993.1 histidine phosphatase family protein [Fictibacillus nanhaiensis]
MTTIGLIRHGITEWNSLGKAQGVSDIPLNELGRKQASEIGDRLSLEEQWDMIITSDLSRAFETAEIIGSKIGLPISHINERVREINCGEIEGTTEEQRVRQWGSEWRNLELGMENFEVVSNRGIAFLDDIVCTYKDKRILVVSHGALIGLTLQKLLPQKFQQTYIDNTSITILSHIEDRWDCPLYNCTRHLNLFPSESKVI